MSETEEGAWEPPADADRAYAHFTKEARVPADDGTPLAYTLRNRTGKRLPVLFANGWSCSDAYWRWILPALEELGHPCLLPDTRGHGRSGLPRPPGRGARNLHPQDVSIPRLAADLRTVLDHAGIDRALVVGHSMGVQTSLELYRLDRERVAGLVLVAGTAENPARTLYGTSLADRTFPLVSTLMRWFPEVVAPVWATIGPASVGHVGARLARAAGPKATAEDLHPYLLHLKAADPAVLVAVAGAMRDHSAADLLPDITVPTLVVAAGRDVFTPARCSEALHHGIVGSELVTFGEAGHTLPIEEPEALAAIIEDFAQRRITWSPRRRRPRN